MSFYKLKRLQAMNSARIQNSVRIPSPISKFTNIHVANQFIEVIVSEVIAFAMYAVLTNAISTANLTGSLKGTNGVLTGLVTLFYILAAALLPVAIVRKSLGSGK